jgi:hypothetical protein
MATKRQIKKKSIASSKLLPKISSPNILNDSNELLTGSEPKVPSKEEFLENSIINGESSLTVKDSVRGTESSEYQQSSPFTKQKLNEQPLKTSYTESSLHRVIYIGDFSKIEIPKNHFLLDISVLYSNRSIYMEIESYISTNRNPILYIPDIRILQQDAVREIVAILKTTPLLGVIAKSDSDQHVHPLLRYFLKPIRHPLNIVSTDLLGFVEYIRKGKIEQQSAEPEGLENSSSFKQQEKRIIEYIQELSDLGFIGDVNPYYKKLLTYN